MAFNVLSNSDLRELAPSIFAEAPHSSRSSRYAQVPTSVVIDGLRKEGFEPVKVSVSRVRDDSHLGFEKHLVRLRRRDAVANTAVGGVFPEVIIVNSHDGSTSYQLTAGLFRLLCGNGLAVPAGQAGEVRIKHTGHDIVGDVIQRSYDVLKYSGLALETAGRWATIALSEGEQLALASASHVARFADAEGNVNTPILPQQLLKARRSDDVGSDLWTTFNRIQENAVRGGLVARTITPLGRRRRVSSRPVAGIDSDLRLNKALWTLADELAKAKTGFN